MYERPRKRRKLRQSDNKADCYSHEINGIPPSHINENHGLRSSSSDDVKAIHGQKRIFLTNRIKKKIQRRKRTPSINII